MGKSIYILILFLFCNISISISQTNLTQYVNPFIGTGGAGHTFPGAVLPFGMVQLSPDTRIDGSWEGCSGYHYSDSVIYGFSHTHLSGTGVSDYGDILVMPTTGVPSMLNSKYSSKFSHQTEKASPGYYQVKLLDDTINAELTATTRVGIHRYTFPKTKTANIIIDLLHRDKTLNSNLKVVDSVTLIGFRVSEAWATEQHVYFVIKFSKPFIKSGIAVYKDKVEKPDSKKGKNPDGGFFQFDVSDGKPLIVKVSISQTDVNGALRNLNAEATHFDFDKYKNEAQKIWEQQLSKIEVSNTDKEKSTVFYSALYHCMIHPSVAGDVDGQYRGRDNKIHTANGFVPYTVYSLWDTFRALHPLFTIIERKRTTDFINSFLHQYDEGGRLPMWELSANETNCMIGFHSVSVIADAFAKNIGGFDTVVIYDAMKAASNYKDMGIPNFNKMNYLQVDNESESVSKTLEYSYDNWCIAQVAQKLKKSDDYQLYMKRAQGYQNLFNTETGFFQPRKNGNWLPNFNPKEVNNHYTEANGWQYNFFVPHNIDGLIKLIGGEKKMENKLDELFNTSSDLNGRTQADITGLIGQYAHGNEPSHHMAYLYNYIGKPFKTQEKTFKILTEFYKNSPEGLIGNEDCGQMSAWYVMSSMGFYQVCPGLPEYTITSPLFENVKINLENGKAVKVVAKNFTNQQNYIKSFSVNGKATNSPSFLHYSIMNGADLEFILQSNYDTSSVFGKSYFSRPHTRITTAPIVSVPSISSTAKLGSNSTTVTISSPNKKGVTRYALNGFEPNQKSSIYTSPIILDSSTTIKAKVYFNSDSSSTTQTLIYKKPNNWKIKLVSKYDKQYSAGSDEGIIDGVRGTLNWRAGEWQGYQGQNFECVIDLGKEKNIQFISSTYLQDTRAWILFPIEVKYLVSTDGINFKEYGVIENGVASNDYSVQIRSFSSTNDKKLNARYIKVVAKNYGKLPDWHLGKGGDAYIFIDEIEIK